MAQRSTYLSWKWLLAYAVLAVLIVLVSLRWLATTRIAHALVEARVEALSVRGNSIEIEGLRGDLLGRFEVRELRIQDEDGTWLRLDRVKVSWSPVGLISGRLGLRVLEANYAEMARRPKLAPASGSNGGGSPVREVRIRDVSIPAIRLLSGVAGPEQLYAGRASFRSEAGTGLLEARLEPAQEGGDRLDLELAWQGGALPSGRLVLEGPADGLFATVLALPAGAGLSASANIKQEDRRWALDASGVVGAQSLFDAQAALADSALTFDGTIDASLIGRLAAIDRLSNGPMEIEGRIGLENRQSPVDISLQSPGAGLSLTGTWERGSGGLLLSGATALFTPGQLADNWQARGVRVAPVRLEGNIVRTASETRFTGQASAESLGLGPLDFDDVRADGEGALIAGGGLDLSFVANAVARDPAGAVPLDIASGPIAVEVDLSRASGDVPIDITDVALTLSRLRLAGSGIRRASGELSLQGDLGLSDLGGLESGDLSWTVSGNPAGSLKIALDGSVVPDAVPEPLRPLGLNTVDVSGTVERGANGRLTLGQFSASTAQLALDGRGVIDAGEVQVDGQMRNAAVHIGPVGIGAGRGRFVVSGPASGLNADLSHTSDNITVSGVSIEMPETRIQLNFAQGLSFSSDLSGELASAPVQANAEGKLSGGRVALETLSAERAGFALTGAGELPLSDPLGGTAQLDFRGAIAAGGEVSAQGLIEHGALTVSGTANGLRAGSAQLRSLDFDVSATPEEAGVDVAFAGDIPLAGRITDFDGRSQFRFDISDLSGAVDLQGKVGTEPVSTPEPITFRLDDARQLKGALSVFGGSLHVDLANGDTPLSARLNAVSLERFGRAIGRPGLRGDVNGGITFRAESGVLSGTSNVVIDGLSQAALTDYPDARLEIDTSLASNALQGHVRLTGETDAFDLEGAFELPIIPASAPWGLRIDRAAPVDVSLAGRAAIAPLWAIAAPPDLRVAGELELDVSGRAPLEQLRLTGPVAVFDGEIEDGQTGIWLKNVAFDGMLSERSIEIVRTSADGGRGGRVSGSGLYRFDGSGNVALQLDDLNALVRDDFSATVSGPVTIERRNARTAIAGNLSVDEARIDLSELPQGGYRTIDVVFTDEEEAEIDEPVREAVELDLTIKGDRRVYVLAPYADTEWSVDIGVQGNPGALDLSGSADLVRGEADLLSRKFRLNDGEIRFEGRPQATRIDLSALRRTGEYTARIRITGSVLAPDISLSSEPSLPEEEILALVLFGRSPSQLSAFEAAQLAGAAASLASGGSGFDLIRPLQAATGLQRLDIARSEDGTFALTTGTYVADDVYLEVVTGASGSPGVSLEWTPLDNVEIDTELDPELGPRVAVQWKWEFDRLGLQDSPEGD